MSELVFADLVRETSTAMGTGPFPLQGPIPGHRGFTAAVPTGAHFHYAIAGISRLDEWETGEGRIDGQGRLERINVHASSADGDAVDFSAGLKAVGLTVGADWFANAASGTAPDIDGVTGLAAALAGKAAADHRHDDDYSASGHGHSFASLTGKPVTLAGYGITDAAAAGHNHAATYQPLDADLSAIAALATTAFGRGQLTVADAAAGRTGLGLGTLATQAANNVAISGGSISGLGALSCAGNATLGDAPTDAHIVNGSLMIAAVSGPAYSGLIDHVMTSPFSRLRITARGGTGGWQGAIDLNVSQNDGASFTALSIQPVSANAAAVSIAGTLRINGTQVAAARRTGWATPAGTASRASFDTANVTTQQLAERVKALIDDLAAHGLIGA